VGGVEGGVGIFSGTAQKSSTISTQLVGFFSQSVDKLSIIFFYLRGPILFYIKNDNQNLLMEIEKLTVAARASFQLFHLEKSTTPQHCMESSPKKILYGSMS